MQETIKMQDWIEIFNKEEEYVIWGCTEFAEALLASVGDIMKVRCIIDSNEALCGSKFYGYEVKSVKYLEDARNVKVIVTNRYPVTRKAICKKLCDMGYKEDIDFSYYQYFISYWQWEYKRNLSVVYMEIPITTICTMKCKQCAAYIPYIKKPVHRSLENIKSDVDKYFTSMDWTARFRLVGGEPLLYPQLSELVEYIGTYYREQIGELTIVTNGTVNPSHELLQIIKKVNGHFFISDYSLCGHPLTSPNQYQELMKILEKYEIRYTFSKTLRWIDLGNPTKTSGMADAQLKERFADCRLDRRDIIDGRIFSCAQWGSAYLAGIVSLNDEPIDEIIEIDAFSKLSKSEKFDRWIKFDLDNSFEKGYISFCDRCDGEGALNQNYVPVGEQLNNNCNK